MFWSSGVMFTVATAYVSMNCYRMVRGFVDFQDAPGGPLAFLGVIPAWSHIFKDVLPWWGILWRSIGAGICGIDNTNSLSSHVVYSSTVPFPGSWSLSGSSQSTPTPRSLLRLFLPGITFYSVAVTQNILTTGLMALRLWLTDRASAQFRLGQGVFVHVILILIESAALYLFVQIFMLALYAANYNAQFIILETFTPLVGITFGLVLITVCVIVRSQELSSSGTKVNDVPTTGMPMRRITVNITTHLEDDSPNSQHRSTESKMSPV
ncbi:hypothetical protein B0H16DRAFT_1484291 [Mycena metata]|uniref:Uncharacterized protein n=1 Tax=Mycena metata TaxID=1033252 RepID=A0AAD7DT49_9AGAR|nr:hypothetical protein B0H16DRAFT_1484291 [Mycena metata]